MKCAIVTGASKGLGKHITSVLASKGYSILGIARNVSTEDNNSNVRYRPFDLADTKKLEVEANIWLKEIAALDPSEIVLINNAAVVEPVSPIAKVSGSEVSRAMAINLVAPTVLSKLFCLHFSSKIPKRVIINISSGASVTALPGNGPYCMAKAGLEMLTRVTAEENEEDGFFSIAVRPGIFETDMQKHLRSLPSDKNLSVSQYKQFSDENMLHDPKEVAQAIVKRFLSETIENGRIYDSAEF